MKTETLSASLGRERKARKRRSRNDIKVSTRLSRAKLLAQKEGWAVWNNNGHLIFRHRELHLQVAVHSSKKQATPALVEVMEKARKAGEA